MTNCQCCTPADEARARLPVQRGFRLVHSIIASISVYFAASAATYQRWAALAVWAALATVYIVLAVSEHRAIRRDESIVQGERRG